jgi:hypothetical protein
MSARTTEAGQTPAAAGLGDEGQGTDWPGRIFRQLTVLPTLLATAWLLAGLPLLLIGHFSPVMMGVVATPIAAVLVIVCFRSISGPAQSLLAQRGGAPARTPWWALAAVVVVAVAFGIDQLHYHSQQIIVSRDPASYIQFGNWIALHGSLPIPAQGAAFGGYSHQIFFSSPAFYQVGHTLVPQFMAGLPMTLAPAIWAGGVSAATAMGALLGACGVLVAGGLVGRLVGARWAPLGALVLALALPEQYTSRSTYSETLAQLLFLGGLCLVVDSFSRDGRTRRILAALGGLALGLTLLARIDGASDLLPLIPYCGLLVLGRARQAWPLIVGLIVGAGYGAIDGLILSRPYLHSIRPALLPLVLVGAAAFVITVLAVMFRWAHGLPQLRTDRLPNLAAAGAFVVLAGLLIRPYVQVTTAALPAREESVRSHWQAAEHLPGPWNRQYYELTLHWVIWYIGLPAVLLATVAVAVLARRCLRGNAPAWTLPLISFVWIILATLWQPSITPDQPWASRRLVPGVLPGFIILAVWAVSWLTGWLRQSEWIRQRGGATVVSSATAVVLSAALIIPTAWTNFGLSLHTGGSGGVQLTANGLADKVTFGGEVAAVDKMCAALPKDASVLLFDLVGSQFTQVVRGQCGLPAAKPTSASIASVRALVAQIQRAGRVPVLLADNPGSPGTDSLLGYGGSQPVDVLHYRANGDGHTLVKAPTQVIGQHYDVWMSEFPK